MQDNWKTLETRFGNSVINLLFLDYFDYIYDLFARLFPVWSLLESRETLILSLFPFSFYFN